MTSNAKPVTYDRSALKTGILHIGVGNFHRAHQERYTDSLITDNPDQSSWAVAGAMLLDSDRDVYQSLKAQNGLYTLTEFNPDGTTASRQIGSLVDVMWAHDDADKIIDKIASPDTKIITLTITQSPYNIDPKTGEFDFDNIAVKTDLNTPGTPISVFGYLAQGLLRRCNANAGPVTILSCDNLRRNGDTTRRAVMAFLNAFDKDVALWAETNITFPNSVVERITPETASEDVERLNGISGSDDAAPVGSESYIRWIIEDRFAAGRPAWEKVGVTFTDDIAPYADMKLSLLNAAQTMLAYPAFLGGYRKVDEAMADSRIVKLVCEFMDTDVTPYIKTPAGLDLIAYKQSVIQRLGNRSLGDQVGRLCTDGISKFPVYIVPTLAALIRDDKTLTRLAYLFAAYRHCLKYQRDDKGVEFEIDEPWVDIADLALAQSDNPLDFLTLPAFSAAAPAMSEKFVRQYKSLADSILRLGAMATLEQIVLV